MSNVHKTESYFNEEYAESVDMYSSSFRVSEIERFRVTLDLIKRHCNPKGSGLDIGCGPGNFTIQIKNFIQHLIGTDISSVVIEKAVETYKNDGLRFEVCGLPATNFDNEEFDFVSAIEIIYYLNDDDRQKAIEDIARILKPNGIFVFSGIISDAYFSFKELKAYSDYGFELLEEHQSYRKPFNRLESFLQKIQKHIFKNSKLTKGILEFPSKSWTIMNLSDFLSRTLLGKFGVHRVIRVYRRK